MKLLIALTLFSSSLYASEITVMKAQDFKMTETFSQDVFEDSTNYDQLNQYFDNGRATQLSEINGWYSGRCYSSTQPNTAVNILLASETRQVGRDQGPLFPPKSVTKLFFLKANKQPANFFDYMNQQHRNEAQNLINSIFNRHSVPFIRANSLVHIELSGKLRFETRTYENYFITKLFNDNVQDFACYFFKKVN